MNVEFMPTLTIQRELYEKPRDMARFRWYIEQLTGSDTSDARDVQLPIMGVNPMGKAHCLDVVNALIAIDAEATAAAAITQAAALLPRSDAHARLFINVLDDRMGGWTDRIFTEFKNRYPSAEAVRANQTRRFCGIWCWTSEPVSLEQIRHLAFDAVYRIWHVDQHGAVRTLRDMLRLDQAAARFTGARFTGARFADISAPTLTPDDLEYTRTVLLPLLDAQDQPTCIAALFGDDAARSCGYPPLGLSQRAGQACAAQLKEIF
jgi:hypothetical protein